MINFSSRSFYASVSTALAQLDSEMEPAECQGMLCGMLCNPAGFETNLWLQHLTGYREFATAELAVGDALNDLLRSTVRGMDADDFGFELLLPDDDEPLIRRADALGGWCRGFLSGFGISRGAVATSAESQEFLSIYTASAKSLRMTRPTRSGSTLSRKSSSTHAWAQSCSARRIGK